MPRNHYIPLTNEKAEVLLELLRERAGLFYGGIIPSICSNVTWCVNQQTELSKHFWIPRGKISSLKRSHERLRRERQKLDNGEVFAREYKKLVGSSCFKKQEAFYFMRNYDERLQLTEGYDSWVDLFLEPRNQYYYADFWFDQPAGKRIRAAQELASMELARFMFFWPELDSVVEDYLLQSLSSGTLSPEVMALGIGAIDEFLANRNKYRKDFICQIFFSSLYPGDTAGQINAYNLARDILLRFSTNETRLYESIPKELDTVDGSMVDPYTREEIYNPIFRSSYNFLSISFGLLQEMTERKSRTCSEEVKSIVKEAVVSTADFGCLNVSKRERCRWVLSNYRQGNITLSEVETRFLDDVLQIKMLPIVEPPLRLSNPSMLAEFERYREKVGHKRRREALGSPHCSKQCCF